MVARSIAAVLTALMFVPTFAHAQEARPDELSRMLFETYLNGPRKINSSTIQAASVIVADRGRQSGFWKEVLAELKSGDEHSEVNCVQILGNMLADDAAARDAIRRQKETGEVSASKPTAYLGPDVVATLLSHAKTAQRHRIDHYVIALARARAPEARDLFIPIIQQRTGPTPADIAARVEVPEGFAYDESTRFHAAVGLAQLGETAGYDWLIANCENPNGYVQHARPHFADRGGSLGTCCQAALQRLADRRDLSTRVEWEAWWRKVDPAELKGRTAPMADL